MSYSTSRSLFLLSLLVQDSLPTFVSTRAILVRRFKGHVWWHQTVGMELAFFKRPFFWSSWICFHQRLALQYRIPCGSSHNQPLQVVSHPMHTLLHLCPTSRPLRSHTQPKQQKQLRTQRHSSSPAVNSMQGPKQTLPESIDGTVSEL